MNAIPSTDPIENVMLLMIENRSFDQMLGCLSLVYPNLEGVQQAAPLYSNQHDAGTERSPTQTAWRRLITTIFLVTPFLHQLRIDHGCDSRCHIAVRILEMRRIFHTAIGSQLS